MKKTINYNSNINQSIKGYFVSKQVIQNVTTLILHLIESEYKGDYEDEMYNLYSTYDYKSSAENNGWIYNDKKKQWTNVDSKKVYKTAKELCDEESLYCDYIEVYEYWIVTKWFADKLKEKGEIVEELFGLNIWGRTTTGQAILLDLVVSEICEDLEILEGQKNDWSK